VQQRRHEFGFLPPLSVGPDLRFMRASDSPSVDVKTIVPSSLCNHTHDDSQDDWNRSEGSLPSLQQATDLIDHSRLARAWDKMLSSRFITAKITSVVPLYLSAIFQTFRALPALEINNDSGSYYPFSSERSLDMFDPEPFRHLGHATVKDDAETSVTWMPASEAPSHFIHSQAPMHLARMAAIVTSCKEAIWDAYNKLYCQDHRSPRPNDVLGKTNVHTMREEFEQSWLNWEWSAFSAAHFSHKLMMMLVTYDLGLIWHRI
jgi:hypothetical protein